MLSSLYIKNFRLFKDFKIESLDHVNLITGKNNTGKSSLLEAVALYASNLNVNPLNALLKYRGEELPQVRSDATPTLNFQALSSLFTNRKWNVGEEIKIGELHNEDALTMCFYKYVEEVQTTSTGDKIWRTKKLTSEEARYADKAQTGFSIAHHGTILMLSLEEAIPNSFKPRQEIDLIRGAERCRFVRPAAIDEAANATLFDDIALTDKEQYVIAALQVVEPATERIAFVKKDAERSARIKLSNSIEVLPLKSLGDGINRILSIILAMVNAENGFLLIDEFENGLHYSAQEQLWKIIFKLAKALNIQVFATTHSEDCISSFERALNDEGNTISGKLIRLDEKKGIVKPVEISANDLHIIVKHKMEIR